MILMRCPKCTFNRFKYAKVTTVIVSQDLLCFDNSLEYGPMETEVDQHYEYTCGNEGCGFKTTDINDIISNKEIKDSIIKCLEKK
jgi:hypothetical protein